MRYYILFLLFCVAVGIRSKINIPRLDINKPNAPCPCSDQSLCKPVQVQHDKEVFGFNSVDWATYDWSVVTTIAWFSDLPNLLCTAHSHNVRLIAAAPFNMPLTSNRTARQVWINATLAAAKSQFIDGITFDYEDPMDSDSPQRQYFNDIVAETTEAFHSELPGSQISVCVAWSPNNIDGRAYDYVGLARASDLLYAMVYDTRSQIFDRCLASANSPWTIARLGITQYIEMGIPPSKLVLGVPWYGYSYPCIDMTSPDSPYCPIVEVPFRGVNCSDAAGSQLPYFSIMSILDSGATITPRRYEPYLQSPYFNYKDPKTGAVHQMWYDDPQSLSAKYKLAKDLGIRGVGPFTFDDLDPTGAKTKNPKAPQEAKEMWAALHVFKN